VTNVFAGGLFMNQYVLLYRCFISSSFVYIFFLEF